MDDKERIERLEQRLERLEGRLFDLGVKMTAVAMLLTEQATAHRSPHHPPPSREQVEEHREMQKLLLEIGDLFGSTRGKMAEIKRRMKTPVEGSPKAPLGTRKR